MEKTKLMIQGMNCMHCVGSVEKALTDLSGTEKVKVQLKKEQATVKYDSNTVTPAQLIEAVREAGYEATIK